MNEIKEYNFPWRQGWREEVWNKLDQKWDVIIIGGGITGAGIMAVVARMGLRVLLLEKDDFAHGTSSRSSKLVHGGLRYLKQMHIKLTRECVQERQSLLQMAPGLVEPLGFIYPVYEGDHPNPWLIEVGLGIYTHLASGAGDYRRLDPVELGMIAPGLSKQGILRGFHYTDAKTDDARLVLRVLHDGLLCGDGHVSAVNYARVIRLLKKGNRVAGVRIFDELSGKMFEAKGTVVINATGSWADDLCSNGGNKHRLRPLRGSHLFFDWNRFPVHQAIAFSHPDDGRPVFVYPWEGITLVGTTDVDHGFPLDAEPSISVEEADYLLHAVQDRFPDLDLTKTDVISTQAGVRPVVNTGKNDPSAESRDHVIWHENGLLTVTGGKLTTFRLIAIDVLRAAHGMNKKIPAPDCYLPYILDKFMPDQPLLGVDSNIARRLWGRYGSAAKHVVAVDDDLLTFVPGTPYIWAELLWAIKHEAMFHLDDLLLRRFRSGILLPDGGQSLFTKLKPLIQKHLNWDNKRWDEEVKRYLGIWRTAHGFPHAWLEDRNHQQ